MPFHISEQLLARSGWMPGATIEPMDIECDCCEAPASKLPSSTAMHRGTAVESSMRAVEVCGVHWVCSDCDSSSLLRNHLLACFSSISQSLGAGAIGNFNLLSLCVTRKGIRPVKGLLTARVCTPVGSLWIVVQFVASPVLGASEDLDYKLRGQLHFAHVCTRERIPCCNQDIRRHVRAFPSSPC